MKVTTAFGDSLVSLIQGNLGRVEGLSIDLQERRLRTMDCPSCAQPDDIVSGIVRVDGRAWIAYDARLHSHRDGTVEAFVDIALGDRSLGQLGDFDGPDGYCTVFSCRIADGRAGLIDAPLVADEDVGWRSNLSREEALTDWRRGEWSEVLVFIADADPILQRTRLHAP